MRVPAPAPRRRARTFPPCHPRHRARIPYSYSHHAGVRSCTSRTALRLRRARMHLLASRSASPSSPSTQVGTDPTKYVTILLESKCGLSGRVVDVKCIKPSYHFNHESEEAQEYRRARPCSCTAHARAHLPAVPPRQRARIPYSYSRHAGVRSCTSRTALRLRRARMHLLASRSPSPSSPPTQVGTDPTKYVTILLESKCGLSGRVVDVKCIKPWYAFARGRSRSNI